MPALGSSPPSMVFFAPDSPAPFPLGEDLVFCVGDFTRRLSA
ncbi:hypothetical protein ABZ791_09410 [Streptomyces huasconensis]|uniref:Uncharacterized protein n=1 Tax=Streptomyces huasconensis TaxID=1854574 RepID=A0ABV3M2K9_9ACTN